MNRSFLFVESYNFYRKKISWWENVGIAEIFSAAFKIIVVAITHSLLCLGFKKYSKQSNSAKPKAKHAPNGMCYMVPPQDDTNSEFVNCVLWKAKQIWVWNLSIIQICHEFFYLNPNNTQNNYPFVSPKLYGKLTINSLNNGFWRTQLVKLDIFVWKPNAFVS